MELIHVELSAAELVGASGPVVVTHQQIEQAGPTRLLSSGQEVVVTDADGEFHAAVVLAVVDMEGQPGYRLHIGVRLPADLAAERIADLDMLPERTPMHDLLDLLGDLRRSERESAGGSEPQE